MSDVKLIVLKSYHGSHIYLFTKLKLLKHFRIFDKDFSTDSNYHRNALFQQKIVFLEKSLFIVVFRDYTHVWLFLFIIH